MKFVAFLLVAVVGVLVVVFTMDAWRAGPAAPAPGGAAGEAGAMAVIPASDLRLEDLRGQVVVMDFWATWCPPCRKAMPGMQALHQRFQGRPVRVLGMNTSENGDPRAFMQKNGYTYTLVTGADDYARRYNVQGIPHFVVLGTDGETLYTATGYSPEHESRIAQVIDEHLRQKGL